MTIREGGRKLKLGTWRSIVNGSLLACRLSCIISLTVHICLSLLVSASKLAINLSTHTSTNQPLRHVVFATCIHDGFVSSLLQLYEGLVRYHRIIMTTESQAVIDSVCRGAPGTR